MDGVNRSLNTSKPPKPAEIKRARLKAGLSQSQAAKLIGYSTRSWQSWEGGQRTMRLLTFLFFKEMT